MNEDELQEEVGVKKKATDGLQVLENRLGP